MSGNEVTKTDQYVRSLLQGISPSSDIWEQGDGTDELRRLLQGGSKSATGAGVGKPEFIFYSRDFLIVVEDKRSIDKLLYLDEYGLPSTEHPYRSDFAANGAIHYAKHLLVNGLGVKGIFAIGAAGDSMHLETACFWVTAGDAKQLPATENFDEYSPENIDEFYRVSVLGMLPKAERDLQEVKLIAEHLHEDMRLYGNLEGERKATTVAAILLALKDPDFNITNLRGSTIDQQTDGWKIYNHACAYLDASYVNDTTGNQKRGAVKDQFTFMRDSITLNKLRNDLGGKTPLRVFTEKLQTNILDHVGSSTSFDILGNFYGEFVRYGGSDGNALGIVLTPHHITTLMAELVDVGKNDYVLDPCAGTAGFLIAAMNRMIESANGDPSAIDDIRANRLHGIELQDKLYAVGVSNMVLRGDGKAHFRRDDMFHVDKKDLRTSMLNGVPVEHGFTKGLLNPPYSQAKNSTTRHLSELNFVYHALEFMNQGAKLAAIVPISAMTNAKGNKETKRRALSKHTLEAVITMNPQTFYGIGTQPAIVIFTAGRPHSISKRVKFMDFRDDGMEVRPHIGLVGDGTEIAKREHMLRVFNGDEDSGDDFIVSTAIDVDDEWLHSNFYYNQEPVYWDDLNQFVGDYLTFKMSMLLKKRGYLFDSEVEEDFSKLGATIGDTTEWAQFPIEDIATIFNTKRLEKTKIIPGTKPYVSSTESNNGISDFSGNDHISTFENVLGVNYNGSVGKAFYHPYKAVFTDDVKALKLKGSAHNKYTLMFIGAAIEKKRSAFQYGYKLNTTRMKKLNVTLPVNNKKEPDWEVMEESVKAAFANAITRLSASMVSSIGEGLDL